MNKRKARHDEKTALFEVFILITSIVAFAYFVGSEFHLVRADPAAAGEIATAKATADVAEASLATPTATVGAADISLVTPAVPAAAPAPAVPLPEPAVPAAQGGIIEWAKGIPTRFIDAVKGSFSNILLNAGIAAALWFVVWGIGRLGGWNTEFTDALALTMAIGYGIGSGSVIVADILWQTLFAGSAFGPVGTIVGIVVGAIAAALAGLFCGLGWFGLCTKIDAVIFTCYPWQPPSGGQDCQKCNKGEFPCTKYKCESLGQSCELLNPGTSDELCEWVNRNDISPPIIESWKEILTEGYQYTPDTARLPPDRGVIIESMQTADKCIPPFSRITYGITLDEPAICKIDTSRTDSFDNMKFPVSNGYYKYNHSIISVNAGATELEAEGIPLENGGNYETFIRCQDKNGNANAGTFVFKYCVSDEPDITAPSIKLTNPINGMPIQQGQTTINAQFYTDKPSDCKWSHNDEDYETMANLMQCDQSITQINANMLYKCTTKLDSMKDSTENKFYIRCKSYPLNDEADRYKNEESYFYKLIGTSKLVIDSVKPLSGATLKDSTITVKATLEARTSAGFKDGEATCYFKKSSETDSNYIMFLNTNSYVSTQDLWLPSGSYRYSIKCCDLGGNCDTETTEFNIETDFEAPSVVRAYSEGNSLKIVTNEKASCVYDTTSCGYEFADGIVMTSSDGVNHFTDWNTNNNFYIKCNDEFGTGPGFDECSITVRPSDY